MRYERPEAESIRIAGTADILLVSGDNEQNVEDLLNGLLGE